MCVSKLPEMVICKAQTLAEPLFAMGSLTLLGGRCHRSPSGVPRGAQARGSAATRNFHVFFHDKEKKKRKKKGLGSPDLCHRLLLMLGVPTVPQMGMKAEGRRMKTAAPADGLGEESPRTSSWRSSVSHHPSTTQPRGHLGVLSPRAAALIHVEMASATSWGFGSPPSER